MANAIQATMVARLFLGIRFFSVNERGIGEKDYEELKRRNKEVSY